MMNDVKKYKDVEMKEEMEYSTSLFYSSLFDEIRLMSFWILICLLVPLPIHQ